MGISRNAHGMEAEKKKKNRSSTSGSIWGVASGKDRGLARGIEGEEGIGQKDTEAEWLISKSCLRDAIPNLLRAIEGKSL